MLTISGDGSLTAIGTANVDSSYGISSETSLTITSGTVTAVGGAAPDTDSFSYGSAPTRQAMNREPIVSNGTAAITHAGDGSEPYLSTSAVYTKGSDYYSLNPIIFCGTL